jgi:hypothetical protein
MAETHFRTAVYWAVERRYPEAGFVFVRWDATATRPAAEVNEQTAGPEVQQVLDLVLQLQDLWLLALESLRDYLDSQLTQIRQVLRPDPQRPAPSPPIPECTDCGKVCSQESWRGANYVCCQPCWRERGYPS